MEQALLGVVDRVLEEVQEGASARGVSCSSKIGGSRVERYVGFIEMLVPLVSTLVALFKKPKVPKSNISALTRVGVATDDSKI